MKMQSILVLAALSLPINSMAAEDSGWFVRPFIGASQMSDLSADTRNLGSLDGSASLDLDSGFNAGIGIGYRYNPRVAVEVAWDYRSNDSSVVLADDSEFSSGDYASNMFYLNGFYFPEVASEKWSPYLGAGLSVMQEIDLDLESNGNETSLSGSGDVGYQLFAGVDYRINRDWSLGAELRYGSTTGIDLDGEGNNGQFKDLDYEPTTVQIGLTYQF